ncbi:unnamed protein product [Choristocarpus tenellus]
MSWFFGNYNWKFLCTPPIPCKKGPKQQAPFFAHYEPIAPFVAIVMGLQHALAMVGGIITVPLLVSNLFYSNLGDAQQQYLISTSLIVSGITSLIQVCQLRIPKTGIVIGTGLVSVMGTSYTFLPLAQSAFFQMKYHSTDFLLDDGETFDGEKAYGAILGTVLVCAWLEIALAFVKPKIIKKIFPPVVTGTTVFLIGAELIGTGLKHWGGGTFCADYLQFDCTNGEVMLPFGSREYIGLGFSAFSMLVRVLKCVKCE